MRPALRGWATTLFGEQSDAGFLLAAFAKFEKFLEEENAVSGIPAAYTVNTIIDRNQGPSATGRFVLKNSVTGCENEVDFTMSVVPLRNDGRGVKITMPHWPDIEPGYWIHTDIERMAMHAFLLAEAEERVGIRASLGLSSGRLADLGFRP